MRQPDDGAARKCGWCGSPLGSSPQQRWCSKSCRQTAWRMRKLAVVEDLSDTPKRLAYADPPYPGMSRKYYRDEASYAGEVDHEALVVSLLEDFDGWALSTSAKTLRDVLPLCPPEVRIAAWVKPNGADARTRGPHNLWEPVLYMPARLRRPGVRDWVALKPARGGGTLMGRKPIGFCAWLFELLGASPADALADLYPGTGVVAAAWRQFCAGPAPSLTPALDVSRTAASDTPASLLPGRDGASRGAGGDSPPWDRGFAAGEAWRPGMFRQAPDDLDAACAALWYDGHARGVAGMTVAAAVRRVQYPN